MSLLFYYLEFMPPKPWETRPKVNVVPDISKAIQSTGAPKEDLPTIPLKKQGTLAQSLKNDTVANTTTNNSLSSSYGGYGSSYGGYGGFGSMYGGYGGSMFGGMGMGGLGGMYGMGGMYGNGNDQPNFLMNMLKVLNSFGCLIYCLGEIGKTLQNNVDGIKRFYSSFKGLCERGKQFTNSNYNWLIDKIKQFLKKLRNLILMSDNKDRSKANRVLNILLRVFFVMLVVSLYPVIRKLIKN